MSNLATSCLINVLYKLSKWIYNGSCYKSVTKMLGVDETVKKSIISYKRLSLLVACTLSIILLGVLRSQAYEDNSMEATPIFASSDKMVQTMTCMEEMSLPCEYVEDEDLYIGENIVVKEAVTGIKETTIMLTYSNGKEETREILDEEIIQEPVARVVHIGTKEKPRYIVPVENYIFTSGFGARWGTVHCGVDLAVPTGTDVAAAAAGEVIQSGWNGGYGISVYIRHDDGSITRYGHMSETLVCVGDKVSQGDIIGRSGSTGDSTGPHLHFEIRIDGEAVDPCNYFDEDIKL